MEDIGYSGGDKVFLFLLRLVYGYFYVFVWWIIRKRYGEEV